jgi:hypothetical protein
VQDTPMKKEAIAAVLVAFACGLLPMDDER